MNEITKLLSSIKDDKIKMGVEYMHKYHSYVKDLTTERIADLWDCMSDLGLDAEQKVECAKLLHNYNAGIYKQKRSRKNESKE